MRRLIILSVVVLPQPDPPRRASNLPRGTCRLTFSTEKRLPPSKDLLTFSRTIMQTPCDSLFDWWSITPKGRSRKQQSCCTEYRVPSTKVLTEDHEPGTNHVCHHSR